MKPIAKFACKINDIYYEKISFYENTDIPVLDRLKIKENLNHEQN